MLVYDRFNGNHPGISTGCKTHVQGTKVAYAVERWSHQVSTLHCRVLKPLFRRHDLQWEVRQATNKDSDDSEELFVPVEDCQTSGLSWRDVWPVQFVPQLTYYFQRLFLADRLQREILMGGSRIELGLLVAAISGSDVFGRTDHLGLEWVGDSFLAIHSGTTVMHKQDLSYPEAFRQHLVSNKVLGEMASRIDLARFLPVQAAYVMKLQPPLIQNLYKKP